MSDDLARLRRTLQGVSAEHAETKSDGAPRTDPALVRGNTLALGDTAPNRQVHRVFGDSTGDGDGHGDLGASHGDRPSRMSFLDRETEMGVVLADPLIGRVVADRYRIVEPLGRGGMGIVYKVEHIRIGKLLAMKLLTGELSQNPTVVKRFKHEALTASKLSSPNTVQVFDFGVSDGLTYLVMELVSGDDLGRVLRQMPFMPAAKLGRIVIQVCNALGEAHHHGIVHRDVKPENVMITHAADESDFVKVLDFGLAKLREGAELNELTSQGAILGTPYFMSPEQVRGDDVDPRSDIYSLGAVMYRALTGHHPFNGPTPMAVFARHLTEMPPPPALRAPEAQIPAGMSEIVMRALAKDAADRFQRIEDLQSALVEELNALGTSGIDDLLDSKALRRLAEGQVVQAAAPAPLATRDEVEAYERKLRRQRILAYAILLLIPAALVAGAYQWLRTREHVFSGVETEPNNQASEATVVPFGMPVDAKLGERLSPTQSDIDVFAFDVPARDVSQLSLRVTSLPNIAMCTQLFRVGVAEPVAQFCPGNPGIDLDIPRFALSPGKYLVTVLQDMNPYGEPARHVLENVSDHYVVTLGDLAAGAEEIEREPNDAASIAVEMSPGQSLSGTLGWASDVDVFCAAPGSEGRFRVTDAPRTAGVVLAATLIVSGNEQPPLRIHTRSLDKPGSEKASGVKAPGDKGAKVQTTDVKSPYAGFEVPRGERTCLALTLAIDPSVDAQTRAFIVPRGSAVAYHLAFEDDL